MGRQVRLDDDVYKRIRSRKRDDETFSEAIARLTGEWTLLDFAAGEPVVDAETHRETLAKSERTDVDETRARLQRQGLDTE